MFELIVHSRNFNNLFGTHYIQCATYLPKQKENCRQNKMPSIGVNLRVTGHCSQGGRKYMEDFFSVAYQQGLADERDFEYAFIGIYDGWYILLKKKTSDSLCANLHPVVLNSHIVFRSRRC